MLQYLRSLRVHSGYRQPLPYVDPLRAGRHPFQIFLLALCVVSAAPYLVGEPTAEAVHLELPLYLSYAWGISLFSGSLIALLGSLWTRGFDVALTLERIGLYITGIAGVVYALCILAARYQWAPFLALTVIVGYLCVRMPVPDRFEDRRHVVEDVLSIAGVVLLVSGFVLLMTTPASEVMSSVSIIMGFGLSCLRRARDIARIFVRAKEIHSPEVLKEEGR